MTDVIQTGLLIIINNLNQQIISDKVLKTVHADKTGLWLFIALTAYKNM